MSNRFSIKAVFDAVDNVTAPIAKIQARLAVFGASASKSLKSIDNVTSGWLGGIKNVSVGVATAAVTAGVALTALAQPGMAFEQQIADLGATSLQTRDQIADLENEALRLGAATQFSATEVAAAMTEMSKAGFDNQQIMDGIAGMVYAASAAGEDLATTTENVSSVMKGMGLETSESARVADVLALASVRTNSSIGSLAESMSKVSSTARQLSVPLEDTVAMVALLQDVGLDASEAGSATATMLTMLSKPTDAVAAKMKKLGVSFKDSAGNMLSPVDVLGQLVKAGEKAGGNMDQVAFFADLVGLRGQKAAVNLKDLFQEGKFTELTEELGKAAGTAEKMAGYRMDTFSGDLDVLLENVKGLQIELFGLSSGPLREVAQGMAKWIDANKGMIVDGIVDFVKTLATNLPTIAKWAERVAKFVGVWGVVALGIKAATVAMAAFNAVVALNPIGLIVLGITAALALIVAFWPEISAFFAGIAAGAEEIGEWIVQVFDAAMFELSAIVSSVVDVLNAYWVMAVEFWKGVWSSIGPFFTAVWDGVVAGVTWAFDTVASLAMVVVEAVIANFAPLIAFWSLLWDGFKIAAQFAFDGVVAAATLVVDGIQLAFGKLTEFFTTLWGGVKDLFWTIVGPIVDTVGGMLGTVASVAAGDVPGLGGAAAVAAPVADPGAPQMVSPQERFAQSVSETTTTTSAEVTIRDETGRAAITKPPRRGTIGMTLAPSGAL